MKNKPTIYDVNAEQEEKDYTHPIEKEVYELLMVNVVNIIVDYIRTFEGFPPELRPIAAKHYRIYAVRLLRQYIDKRDFENDFSDVLKAFEPKFKEVVMEWYKKRTARIHRKINDNPTDELYSQIIHDQFKAENEFIINPSNDLLPTYSEQLTLLITNLEKRRAVVGSFDKQERKGKRPPKSTKPFFEHLIHPKQEVLAEICRSIFNKNESAKDYAIMLCLISERGFVVIMDKKRKDFFESWYKYINRQLPKRSNFTAINKHIVDKSANGFVFKNEDDTDYYNLKEAFDKALVNSKI